MNYITRFAVFVASLSIVGAAGYYLNLLTQPFAIIAILVCAALAWWFCKKIPQEKISLPSRSILFSLVPIAVLTLSALSLLSRHQILEPVRSPWLMIPPIFFLLLFLISLVTTARPNKWLIVLFFFLIVSVATIAYPLGYGFDGFIHKATEQHILEHGTISPKPLYYAGQYGLVLILSHAFFLPIDLVDTLLLPLLAALLLPLFAFQGFKAYLGSNARATWASLALFLLPLSSFITTTPQGLANMWSLLAILSALPILGQVETARRAYLVPAIFALAAIATHPLAGIPITIYLALLFFRDRKPIFYPLALLSAILLPLIFIVNSVLSHLPVRIAFATPSVPISFYFANRFQPLLDLVYLVGWNRILIVIAMTIGGIVLLKRAGRSHRLPLYVSLILLVNYFLLSAFLHFDFLIDYERNNYAARIFEMAQFLLIPYLGFTLAKLHDLVSSKPLALRAGFATLVAIIMTASVYVVYPRHDNYEISRGFNVGTSDYTAVRYIHDQNEQIDYVVLANQAVSAAAMDEYGFVKYYNGDVFYYPIPTGGAMYQIYLKMVSEGPTRDRALQAMNLTGVDHAYFVINEYWSDADKIVENAKREAASWTSIDNGAMYVFEYKK